MSSSDCPGCGKPVPSAAAACPHCGRIRDASAAPTQPTTNSCNGSVSPEQVNGIPVFEYTPEFMEWARQLDTEEEIVAGLREIEETGGLELKDFIHELE